MYIVKLMSGEKFEVQDSEFTNMAKAKGSVFVPSLKTWINMSSVSTMYPQTLAAEDRKSQLSGFLHDGTKVIRQFGQWFCDDGNLDEQGRLTVRPDYGYYPEVAVDVVASPAEWEQLGHDFYELNAERINRARLGTGKPESIGGLLEAHAQHYGKKSV